MPISEALSTAKPSYFRLRLLKYDRYVLTEVIGPFLGGLLFFLFIFLMFQILRIAELLIVHDVPGATLGKMTLLMALSFVPTALPVAFLIAVLMAFGRFSADSELVAMKASGLSLLRLSLPISVLAIGVVFISMALNVNWVPWGERTFKSTLLKVSNTKAVSAIKEGAFTSNFFDLLIFAEKIDPSSNQLEHVFIYDEREPKNPLTVVARKGEIVPVKTDSELGSSALLNLFDGSIHRNDLEGSTYQKIDFGQYRLFLKIDEGADTNVMKPHMIPQDELLRRIRHSDASTYEGREMRGEYWRRYATALSPLIFVFMGIGFGTVRTRSVRSGATLTAFLVLIAYWGIQTMATAFMKNGVISPIFAMQLPNLVILIIAVYGFRRAMW